MEGEEWGMGDFGQWSWYIGILVKAANDLWLRNNWATPLKFAIQVRLWYIATTSISISWPLDNCEFKDKKILLWLETTSSFSVIVHRLYLTVLLLSMVIVTDIGYAQIMYKSVFSWWYMRMVCSNAWHTPFPWCVSLPCSLGSRCCYFSDTLSTTNLYHTWTAITTT